MPRSIASVFAVVPCALITAAVILLPVNPPSPTDQSVTAMFPLSVEEIPSEPGEDLPGRQDWENMQLRVPSTGRIPADMAQRERAFARTLPRRGSAAPLGVPDKFQGWTSRGPWNVGGRTRALAIDVSDPTYSTLLAGGVSGGLWRTTDDGASWYQVIGTEHVHQIQCVTQDTRPGHEHVWYAGTGEVQVMYTNTDGRNHRGDGIYKSVDNGLTWDLLPSTSTAVLQAYDQPFDYVGRIVVDISNLLEDELYAATGGMIQRSVDGGATWTRVLGDPDQLSRYTDVTIDSQGVVYAALSADGGVSGVFRSPDGISWTNLNAPILAIDFGRICLGLAPTYETLVFVLVANQQSYTGGELFRYRYLSGNGTGSGGEWLNLSGPLEVLPSTGGGYQTYGPQRGFNMHITVNPTNHAYVYLGGQYLWRSFQGWLSEYVDMIGGFYPNHHVDQHALVFQPGSGKIAYTASDGGVHKTLDIGAAEPVWTPLNNGYLTTQFYTVAVDHARSGDPVVVGGTQDNNTNATLTTAPQNPWHVIFGGDGGYCTVLDGPERDFVASYFRSNTFRVDYDKDASLTRYTKINPETDDSFMFINPALSDPEDVYVLYIASNHGIWRNTDIRDIPWENWLPTTINWGRLTYQPAADPVSALGANDLAGHALYYGTSGGRLYRVDDVLDAPDGTTPVELTGNAAFPVGAWLSGIAVHPDDEAKVLVSFSNYEVSSLWYTEDWGLTWAEVEGNLAGPDGPSVLCLAIYTTPTGDAWFAGTSVGVFSTMNTEGGPVTWLQEAPDLLGNVIVRGLTVRQADGLLAAATHGRGMFTVSLPSELPLGLPADSLGTDVPPSAVLLAQNVPNPFNPRTVIAFTLDKPGRTKLEVFDLRGRRIRVLVDEALDAAPHTVTWQGDDDAGRKVAAGTYLYRLVGPEIYATRSMVLVR